MIKNILAVGDSFTYGEELDNIENAYPYYLAKGLKADVVNLGQPSGGNWGTRSDCPTAQIVAKRKTTWMRAKLGNFAEHKKIAKITFPMWLYVAVTGVVVYLMISPYYV